MKKIYIFLLVSISIHSLSKDELELRNGKIKIVSHSRTLLCKESVSTDVYNIESKYYFTKCGNLGKVGSIINYKESSKNEPKDANDPENRQFSIELEYNKRNGKVKVIKIITYENGVNVCNALSSVIFENLGTGYKFMKCHNLYNKREGDIFDYEETSIVEHEKISYENTVLNDWK